MAPLIAGLLSQGLSLVANAVMVKGQEWVEEKSGVKLTPNMPPERLVELREFELGNETRLMELRIEDNRIGLEELKLDAADKADARDREVKIEALRKDQPWWQYFAPSVTTVLALIVVVGGGWLFQVTTEESARLAIVSIITMVLTYYFGGVSSNHGMGKILSQVANRGQQP